MKRILILAFVATVFMGCGTVIVPTPVVNDTITPNENCHQ